MLIFIEELERWGVARAPDQGIVMIGPILMSYGSPEQREQYLPAALTGEQIWCQGYSEPEAGSDLAALATRAVLDGEEFIVNGQKTWTTHGLDATHMYCLVRTDPNVKPQAGISFLLIDLRQPGVTVRPIVNLGGHVDFCEVFLDNVRVPRHNVVGELNAGWTIAKSLLGHERLFVGSPKLCQHAVHQLRELLVANGQIENAAVRDALTGITLDVLDLEALYGEYAAIVKQGGVPGVDISVLKIWSTETYVRLSEMILEAAGDAAGIVGKQAFGDARIDVLSHFYNARPAPIYAGSNEIQRNILAKQVLRLPT
jgi:alkylation response protein AidB-like acyl-CoA dehydrogenase